MPTPQYAVKVLRRWSDGLLRSYNPNPIIKDNPALIPFTLIYPENGKWVRPKMKGSYLYLYATIDEAKRHVCYPLEFEFWEVAAYNLRPYVPQGFIERFGYGHMYRFNVGLEKHKPLDKTQPHPCICTATMVKLVKRLA